MSPKRRFTEESFRKEPWFRALCQGLLSCKSEEQVADLLRDIGSLGELQDWSERLEIARQLAQGLSYREVAAAVGVSTTTVTKVAQRIENGTGGYRTLLRVHRHHRMLPKVMVKQEQPANPSPSASMPPSALPERPDHLLQKYLGKKQV